MGHVYDVTRKKTSSSAFPPLDGVFIKMITKYVLLRGEKSGMNYLTTEMKVKLNAKICIDISLSSNTEPTYRLSQLLPCMCNHISYFKVCAG